ncbi:MAG: hypothetical protein QOF08_1058 [Gaiellales bacterium]|jgi:hypothetical protein|nr:hypothetical protein [Gaiellales bacterium]
MNKRKTMIGYVTYQVGRRVVRRQVRRRVTSLLSTPERSSLRRRLPLVGAVVALAAAAAAVVFTRQRSWPN